ncbi:MAG: carboxypeptidase-like regulatory domain-containing protein, partial [Tannerella sp.]|nr:carboxypeptidase-like regulatory domain-containing protein [Tannerella sp.]
MEKQKYDYLNLNGNYWKIPLLMLAFSLLAGTHGAIHANGITDKGESGDLSSNTTIVQQQKITVKGVVKDESGEPVIGANVVEKGTANGTSTDVDGNFTISVANGVLLEISYIGYIKQEVTVRDASLNVTLKEDTQTLDEVVVTGFGLSQRKATLTGAISVIGATDISRSVSSTASGALAGKLPGVNFRQPDGRPGASTSIQIRNMGTPLYVIDGVISDEGQFNNIDFNDIE